MAAIIVFLLLSLLVACQGIGDFGKFCPQGCKCKWSHGKRQADCAGAGFTSIPEHLSREIQTLILNDNPLRVLGKNAFKRVGLLNLQKISLVGCQIEELDDKAFWHLKILRELDISVNNISKLHPKTFEGNDMLQILKLNHNPIRTLVPYQFPPLQRLKSVDLSRCDISSIDRQSFKNLEMSNVETIYLHENQLRSVPSEVFVPLRHLTTLTLYDNPWSCDCNLKSFRDWTVDNHLYKRPTSCNEPERLHNKKWDEIHPSDFACKPTIDIPYAIIFGAPGVNATLSCHITGSPTPQARWVVNGRIVNNNTRPTAVSEQTYIIMENHVNPHQRWYNLTITNPNYDDLGDYTCVAENNGGVMEKIARLTFDDPSVLGDMSLTRDQLTLIIGAAAAGLLFILLVILIICCCFCKPDKLIAKESKNHHHHYRNGGSGDTNVANSDSRQLLLTNNSNTNPLPKPPRVGEYQGLPQNDNTYQQQLQQQYLLQMQQQQQQPQQRSYIPADKYDVEMSELRSNSNGSSENNGTMSRASFHSGLDPDQYPDLLDIPNRYKQSSSPTESGSTMPDHTRLIQHHHHHHLLPPQPQVQGQPTALFVPLSAATLQQGGNGAFLRTGTLPLPQHHYRSIPPQQHPQTILLPVVQQVHQRPGYVTLPRRPRASFSSTNSSTVPSPVPSPFNATMTIDRRHLHLHAHPQQQQQQQQQLQIHPLRDREPIYDGVGPRTSADGSSRLSLNKSAASQSRPSPNQRYTLPPYCAPIQEECSQPQNHNLTKSGPSIPDLAPQSTSTPAEKRDNSNEIRNGGSESFLTSTSSENTLLEENLSSYCEPFGKAVPPTNERQDSNSIESVNLKNSKNNKRNSVSSVESNDKQQIIPNGKVNNSSSLKPTPPKTLPKPAMKSEKVKPIPPPKPKKSADGTPIFQDEGADGSEV